MLRELQTDIWGNITYYRDIYIKNIWFKQSYYEDKLIRYEDYQGNYWTTEFGDFPYSTLDLIDETDINYKPNIIAFCLVYENERENKLAVKMVSTHTPFRFKQELW